MDSLPAREIPREKGSPVLELPIKQEGPTEFYPPVCLQTHWDPTSILRWTLPEGYVPQTTDPRPWTRICMEYTTAGEQDDAPAVNPNIVMPTGGKFYPASRYIEAIDSESQLRVLDRPLGTCEGDQWMPTLRSDMYNSRILVPERKTPLKSGVIEELAYPRALLRSGPYDCRAENDLYAIKMSSDYMFNNATKQDRYKAMKKPVKPAPPSGSLKAAPEQLRPDLLLNAGPPRPVAASPIAVVSGSTATQQQPVWQSGSGGGAYYNPNDLNFALAQNEKMRADKYLVGGAAALYSQPTPNNPQTSYTQTANNQRADLVVNATAPTRMITTPYAENSPYAAF